MLSASGEQVRQVLPGFWFGFLRGGECSYKGSALHRSDDAKSVECKDAGVGAPLFGRVLVLLARPFRAPKTRISGVDICSHGYGKKNLMIRDLGNLYMSKRRELRHKGVPDWWDRALMFVFITASIILGRNFPLHIVLMVSMPLALLYRLLRGVFLKRKLNRNDV